MLKGLIVNRYQEDRTHCLKLLVIDSFFEQCLELIIAHYELWTLVFILNSLFQCKVVCRKVLACRYEAKSPGSVHCLLLVSIV